MDGFHVEVSPDFTLSWTHISHLSYDDFGRSENIQHYKIAKFFEFGRYCGLRKGVLNFNKIVNRQYGVFVLGMHYTIQPAFWKVHRIQTFPFKISLEVVDLGRTSATLYSQLINKLDNTEMADSYCKVVYVNRSTRRPTPFPDSVQQMYAAAIQHKHVLDLPVTVPEIPATAHCYDVTVAASDMDVNRHTNQGSYLRFCCDAVQDAVAAGALQGFQIDIQKYPLKELKIIYVGESEVGNKLQVLLWQASNRNDMIHVAIIRSDGGSPKSVIFHGYMVYGLNHVHPRL